MMREGDKLASYRLLAQGLSLLPPLPWTLAVAGDGPARAEVETLFAPFAGRVAFLGQADGPAALRGLYEAAELLVWPAVNEAYGMVFLEAQACGCPVVAGAYGGVPSVVEDGRTGLLTPAGDPATFARAVAHLIGNPQRRQTLGAEARRFVRDERGLGQAARRLRDGLAPLIGRAAS